jgi:hypothetical protein
MAGDAADVFSILHRDGSAATGLVANYSALAGTFGIFD